MLSTPSFTDELKAYSVRLTRARDAAVAPRRRGRPTNRLTAYQQHLCDWMEDDRAQDIWARLKERAPNLEPQDFIREVLAARARAVGTVKSVAIHKAGRTYWMHKYGTAAAALFSSRHNLSEIADKLEYMAEGLRDLDEHYAFMARHHGLEEEVSRQGCDDRRARRLFVRQIAWLLYKHCSEWRDGDNKALTEIAFLALGEVDEAQIRAMRRAPAPSSTNR
jgi:hypothetical protein